MGLIRAVTGMVGGSLADQWIDVIEPDSMNDQTVMTMGIQVHRDKRGSNRKATPDYITDGSTVYVEQNQCMMLVDGGKIIDYTVEPGYFTVDNKSAPSLFNGQIGASFKSTFERFKYGGMTPQRMQVVYINLQEIKGIKFGTRNPINYFDMFYNAELFLRAHGTYSIHVTDPLLFFAQAIPRDAKRVEINEINEQYLSEFLDALQAAINQMSVDGERISFVPSKSRELSKYMQTTLDEDWRTQRGMEVMNVGIASITYDDESTKLINMRNQGAMLGDPNVREGYVQGSIARGMEAAGSNDAGAMAGFMGMGVGMNQGGAVIGAASNANQQQMQNQQNQNQQSQTPVTLTEDIWTCSNCHIVNHGGKFCSNCGNARPQANASNYTCSNCQYQADPSQPAPKFCPQCGTKMND